MKDSQSSISVVVLLKIRRNVDKYISGLPDNIYGNVKSARPKTLDETIELANDLMDQKLCTYAERQSDNKRKVDDSSRNNHGHQQQPFKRQNVAKVYNMGTGEKKPYGGSLPKYTKCHFHHNVPCTQKCHKCNKVGHFARDCRSSGNTNGANTQKGNGANPKGNGCFECGAPRHFKRDCLKLKNKDGGNRNAQGWVYAEKKGNASRDPDSNVVTVVMSSASSAVTYTSVYTDSEPGRVFWGADEEISEGGSPRVIVLGYDGLPIQPVAPPSPDYIPDSEEPQTPPVPQDEDEQQPLSLVDLHLLLSHQGCLLSRDPKRSLRGVWDDETEDGPVDYPIDGEEDGDDDDGDSSGDDADDKDEEDEEDDEEEEHLAPVDSAIIVPTASISLPLEAEVERLLAMPTPPPSPLTSLSPPSAGERLARCTAPSAHSSPPHFPSPLLLLSGCPTQIQTLKIASTQALVDAGTAALPPPPLPPLPLSLYIPPPVDCRDNVPESEQPPRKRSCLFALGSRDDEGVERLGMVLGDYLGIPADLYALLENAQDSRTRIAQRVTMDSQRVDLLMGDRMTLQETVYAHEVPSPCTSGHRYIYSRYSYSRTAPMYMRTRSQLQQVRWQSFEMTDHRRQAQMKKDFRVMWRHAGERMGGHAAELLALRRAVEKS
ncbi:putative reverse transcriptase domain-containing protein [Tanacetum coccineum]